ncbi:MAG: ABC transporter permease [Ignavibacteriaceae bacterium]
MLKNYLKIAIRNLIKHKLFSFINILGLAIGITCCILIILFVNYENCYDKYNEKVNRTYRLVSGASMGNTKINSMYSSAITFSKLLSDFPEIETGVKLLKFDKTPILVGNKSFYESKLFAVDPTFYDVFTIPLLQGDPKTALSEPNCIVLSKNKALKYFGKTDVIGKVITLSINLPTKKGNVDFKISGVSENMPENSHFHYDMLISSTTFPQMLNNTGWWVNNFISYLVLKKGTSKYDFDNKLIAFNKKYMDAFNRQGMGGKSYDDWAANGNYWTYYLQPLTDIHLNSHLDEEIEPNGNSTYTYIFSIIGIIILLIACLNFMNLSTARSSLRAKEVGLRKVVGSSRNKLIFQFLLESVMISIFAIIISLVMVEILLPYYREFVQKPITINYLENIGIIPALILLGLFVGIISGSYPAFVLSSFKPVSVLRKNIIKKSNYFNFRNALVLFQFAISIFLITGTLIVYQQLRYLQNKNLGFDKEQVLVIKNRSTSDQNMSTFKEVLQNNRNIVEVSGSTSLPGTPFYNHLFRADGIEPFTLSICMADYNYQKTLKFEMLKGRFFSKEFPTDAGAVILNEEAVKLLGWDNPLGKSINYSSNNWRDYFHIVGIVKDFHYESLHQKIRPMALFLNGGNFRWAENYISVRIKTGNLPETIKFVKSEWDEFASGVPFEYSFLNEDYDNLYTNEKQTEQLLAVFSFLAIFIACLGLLGLASYIAGLRTKEIGIRKILGASVSGIVLSLSTEFIKWVVLANIIAWPLAYYFMNNWLQNFAYRINISWWVFIFSGSIALLIAFATVSFQAIKAATANPVKSLRYE